MKRGCTIQGVVSVDPTRREVATPTGGRSLSSRRAILIVGLLAALAGLAGVGARATYGARTSADEPQYLLTAQSLADDLDLDISDELAAEAYRPYHENRLDPQTTPVDAAGRQFSPHDPLLPLLLAVPMAIGGWVGAKLAMVALATMAAMVTAWTAIHRFEVGPGVAVATVGSFAAGAPLAAYSSQVYPEIVAALAVVTIVAAATAPRLGRRELGVIVIALIALPWLAVKYVPVAAAVAVISLWPLVRQRRWPAVGLVGIVLAGAGVAYLVIHQRIYGGWTVYAAGDHFAENGEFSVIGVDPNYPGRTRRLVGLLVDRRFGLIPWAPIWLLVPAGVVRFAVDRQVRRAVVLAPLLAGWLMATFVALTMHGWWSPGRQVVVIVPLAAIAVARLVAEHRALLRLVIGLGLAGAANWLWLAAEASTGRRTVIVDFFETTAPFYRAVSWLFAPGWPREGHADTMLVLWAIVLVATVVSALRRRPDRAAPAG